jgi:hypothetical protein
VALLASCSHNNNNNSGGNFTPPTYNYLSLDSKEHDSSTAQAQFEPGVPEFRVSRSSFTNPTFTAPITNVYGFWIYATMVISETYTTQTGNASAPDTYYLTGNIYISKLNGKLRYTSDGPVIITNTNNAVLKHVINFSISEDAGVF